MKKIDIQRRRLVLGGAKLGAGLAVGVPLTARAFLSNLPSFPNLPNIASPTLWGNSIALPDAIEMKSPDTVEGGIASVAAISAARNPRQVFCSAGVGLFSGGTQRTALVMRASTSVSPSSGRSS